MTPLLQQLLCTEITNLFQTNQRKEPKKTQEVFYETEKMSPTEEIWEIEVEESTEVLYEDERTPVGKTELLSVVDVLRTTEKPTPQDKKSELKGQISVTDTSKRKENRMTTDRITPKKEEITVIVQESESLKDKDISTVQDETRQDKTKKGLLVWTSKSPTEEITDKKKDSTSVSFLPDKQDISKQQTRVTVKKESEITIKPESREKHKREEPAQTITIKETEIATDIPFVREEDKTKPSPEFFITEERKLEIEVKTCKEVPYKEFDHGTDTISAIPEENVRNKPTKMISTQLKVVEDKVIGPPFISDSKKGPEEVSVTKEEPAERKKEKTAKADEISKIKEKVPETSEVEVRPEVKPEESVTDDKLKKTKVREQEDEKTGTEYKKKGSRDVPPQSPEAGKKKEESFLIEDIEEKKRISPQTPSRGTERNSNIRIISISNYYDSRFGCRLCSFLSKLIGNQQESSFQPNYINLLFH